MVAIRPCGLAVPIKPNRMAAVATARAEMRCVSCMTGLPDIANGGMVPHNSAAGGAAANSLHDAVQVPPGLFVEEPRMAAERLDDIIDWLIDGARSAPTSEAVLAELCERLAALGIPLWRAGVFVSTPHPDLFGRS